MVGWHTYGSQVPSLLHHVVAAVRVPEVVVFPPAISVRDANTPPFATHLKIMLLRVVDLGAEPQGLGIQPPDRTDNSVSSHHQVPLIRDECDLGIQQRLLGVQHVEKRALSNPFFFPNTVECNLAGIDRNTIGLEPGTCGLKRPIS